jgi:hypothetical protein
VRDSEIEVQQETAVNNIVVCYLLVVAVLAMSVASAQADGPPLAHMVYFKLKDSSEASRKKLVDACQKYLSKHPGEMYFNVGVLAKDLKREVNDQEWDVALIVVFKDKAAHDKYQTDSRHLDFIKEEKGNWAKVRVFDAYLGAGEKATASPAVGGEKK